MLHTKARTGTLRARLIGVPARLARSAGRLVLHLPTDWPYEPGFDELFRQALHDPSPPRPDHQPRRGPTGDHSGRAGRPAAPARPAHRIPERRSTARRQEQRLRIQAQY